MKKHFFLLVISILLCVFCSCQSKEERVISGLEKLAAQIDKRADSFTDKDWEDVMTKYEELHKQALECDFTQEQLKELGRVEGRLTTIFAKEGTKKIGRDIKDLIDGGKAVIDGFLQGVDEVVNDKE